MKLSLDYSNMLSDVIGAEYGVSSSDIEAFKERTCLFHQDIQRRREAGDLPFFDLPEKHDVVDEVLTLAAEVRTKFENLIVLGIGGSALGTAAVFNALCYGHNLKDKDQRGGLPRLFVLDNVDPDGFAAHLDLCDPQNTCFIVISKSGTTVETTSQFLVARKWVEDTIGENFRDHFILITDPEKGVLRELADKEGYLSCSIPAGVGGRFSVLTPVGLLPLACVGIDIKALLKGASDLAPHVCHDELENNPAYLNATLQYLAYQKGLSISVFMPYSDRLKGIADWYKQLWAESLGKKYSSEGKLIHVGPTPVNAIGSTDQHSQVQLYMEGPFDKVITFLTVEEFIQNLPLPEYHEAPQMNYLAGHSLSELISVEQKATAAALAKNRRANCTISVETVNCETLGALIYMFEVQTLFAGYLFDVDPLDQPGVEEGKQFTYALMGRKGYDEKAAEYINFTAQNPSRVLVCE